MNGRMDKQQYYLLCSIINLLCCCGWLGIIWKYPLIIIDYLLFKFHLNKGIPAVIYSSRLSENFKQRFIVQGHSNAKKAKMFKTIGYIVGSIVIIELL